MLKLGKMTDYATLVMVGLAADPCSVHSAHELATDSHIGLPTVSKLLRLLAQHKLVESVRGVNGGYRLARSAECITVADIIAAVEGPLAVTECSGEDSCCSIESHCGVRTNWRLINTAISSALESVSLQQMVQMQAPAPQPAVLPLRFFHTRPITIASQTTDEI